MTSSENRRRPILARGGNSGRNILPLAVHGIVWMTTRVVAFVGPTTMTAQRASMMALSSPSSSLAAFEPMLTSTTMSISSEVGDTVRSIIFTDVGAEAGDAFRSIIYGAIGFIVAVFVITAFVTAVALPQFEKKVKESDPEKYESIKAKLGEGETTIWQRGDLIEELVVAGLKFSATEGDEAIKELLASVKNEKLETGKLDMDKVEEQLKEITDFTIDGYIVGVRNFEKKQMNEDMPDIAKVFVTETDKELVAILEEELGNAMTS